MSPDSESGQKPASCACFWARKWRATQGDGNKDQSAHAGHGMQEAHSFSFCSQAASVVPGARVVLWDLQAACKTSVRSSNRTAASECIVQMKSKGCVLSVKDDDDDDDDDDDAVTSTRNFSPNHCKQIVIQNNVFPCTPATCCPPVNLRRPPKDVLQCGSNEPRLERSVPRPRPSPLSHRTHEKKRSTILRVQMFFQ